MLESRCRLNHRLQVIQVVPFRRRLSVGRGEGSRPSTDDAESLLIVETFSDHGDGFHLLACGDVSVLCRERSSACGGGVAAQ
jgi:hypothetical protein